MTRSRREIATGLSFLALSTFVALTSELLPVGLLPELADANRVSEGTAGLAVSVFAVCVALFAIPLARATDRFPRRPLLAATIGCYALGNLVVALAPDFGVVLAGRAIGGIGHAVFYSVVTSYTARLVAPHLVGRAMTVAFAGGSLGGIFGVPIATSIGLAYDWRTAFAVMAAVAALLAGVVAFLLPSVETTAPSTAGGTVSLRAWWRTGLIAVAVVNTLLFLGQHFVYTYVTTLLRVVGITGTTLSVVLFGLGVVSIGGLLAAGALVDRRPRLGVLLHVGVVALSLAALGPALAVGDVPTLVAVGVWNVAFAGVGTFMMTAAIRTGGTSPSVAGALINSSSNVGIALGSASGGVVLAATAPAVLPGVGAAIAVVSLVVLVVARQGFPSRPHRELHLNTTGSIRTILPPRRRR